MTQSAAKVPTKGQIAHAARALRSAMFQAECIIDGTVNGEARVQILMQEFEKAASALGLRLVAEDGGAQSSELAEAQAAIKTYNTLAGYPEPPAQQPQSELVKRLRNFFIDYDKSQLPDGAEPMPGLHVRDLREAADRIEALEALREGIKCALGTDEDGEALVDVARNAHRAEQELAAAQRKQDGESLEAIATPSERETILVEALQFYAGVTAWLREPGGAYTVEPSELLCADTGHRARTALAAYEKREAAILAVTNPLEAAAAQPQREAELVKAARGVISVPHDRRGASVETLRADRELFEALAAYTPAKDERREGAK